MESDTSILVATAFSVGVVHTLLGPDHYVPFVAMSRSNGWTARKTLWITALCGFGHIGGSVVIGLAGLALGTAIFRIESLESLRGEGAAWLLIGFGLAYFTWGIVAAVRSVPHTHLHAHADGTVHAHPHTHDREHRHVHHTATRKGDASVPLATTDRSARSMFQVQGALTPWVLFLIFVFGPCEVLIPLLLYPAAQSDPWSIAWVVGAFTLATVGAMVGAVAVLVFGLQQVRLPDMHRYGHALAGMAVLLCGLMVKLGW